MIGKADLQKTQVLVNRPVQPKTLHHPAHGADPAAARGVHAIAHFAVQVFVAKHRPLRIASEVAAIEPPLEIPLALFDDSVVFSFHLKRLLLWVCRFPAENLIPKRDGRFRCFLPPRAKKARWFKD